ncbi:hypothetical protein [Streptomyces sp. NPDC006193]|uniref:hypothetical protein n=1 Tax=Streptomyces sp. NPDC006193 TaxID=3155717 RepID=UPI0033BE28D3
MYFTLRETVIQRVVPRLTAMRALGFDFELAGELLDRAQEERGTTARRTASGRLEHAADVLHGGRMLRLDDQPHGNASLVELLRAAGMQIDVVVVSGSISSRVAPVIGVSALSALAVSAYSVVQVMGVLMGTRTPSTSSGPPETRLSLAYSYSGTVSVCDLSAAYSSCPRVRKKSPTRPFSNCGGAYVFIMPGQGSCSVERAGCSQAR